MSLDLPALALALDGARPLPVGSARLFRWDGETVGLRRVPASAFVNVRRRTVAETVAPAAEPAPAPAAQVHPLRRPGAAPAPAPAVRPRMPRRHKLMLAAAAVVMSLGFLGAGAQRLGHPVNAAASAPAQLAG